MKVVATQTCANGWNVLHYAIGTFSYLRFADELDQDFIRDDVENESYRGGLSF